MYEVASRAVRTDAGDVERVTELGAVAGMTRQRPQLQRPVRELALQALQHTHIHPFNGPFSGTTQVGYGPVERKPVRTKAQQNEIPIERNPIRTTTRQKESPTERKAHFEPVYNSPPHNIKRFSI